MHTKPIGLAATLVLTTLLAPLAAPLVEADECPADSSGFGEEVATCNFTCSSSAPMYVNVHASVDDNGDIEGSAACATAGAHCVGLGECHASSYPASTPPETHTFGACTGKGDGGWWTHASVTCWTTDASGTGGGKPRNPVRLGDVPPVDVVLPPVVTPQVPTPKAPHILRAIVEYDLDLPTEFFQGTSSVVSLAALSFGEGTVQGLSCDADRCVPVVPECVTRDDGWTCWV